MVTSYKLESDSITPDPKTNLQITFKNHSSTKVLYNIKLTLSDPNGEILTTGMPTKYVKVVSAGYTYTWNVEVMAINTASTASLHFINIKLKCAVTNCAFAYVHKFNYNCLCVALNNLFRQNCTIIA
ncbi:MAG: hypothetical protein IJA80_01920 [Clostridia bacterium]|nr:hypothetical protein [Clostridia bacterium]